MLLTIELSPPPLGLAGEARSLSTVRMNDGGHPTVSSGDNDIQSSPYCLDSVVSSCSTLISVVVSMLTNLANKLWNDLFCVLHLNHFKRHACVDSVCARIGNAIMHVQVMVFSVVLCYRTSGVDFAAVLAGTADFIGGDTSASGLLVWL